ncbi:MAG: hypothetical protein JO140_04250 [Candidatus Eremiobacteraeota bacterium]|nr:hypothetical protein [Candidatus Eremiobacteraeota bacterium]
MSLPSPMFCSIEESDREYFNGYANGKVGSLDHIWTLKLISEHRWRVLGSSDLFFVAELTAADIADKKHTYPVEGNRQYNEEFAMDLMNTRANQPFVVHLRSEPSETD